MTNLVECRDLRLGYGSNAMIPCPDFAVGAGTVPSRPVCGGLPDKEVSRKMVGVSDISVIINLDGEKTARFFKVGIGY